MPYRTLFATPVKTVCSNDNNADYEKKKSFSFGKYDASAWASIATPGSVGGSMEAASLAEPGEYTRGSMETASLAEPGEYFGEVAPRSIPRKHCCFANT